MKATEGKTGRVFVVRLEDGDVLPECLEQFAREKSIRFGQVTLVGGIGSGEVVAGPRLSDEMPPDPVYIPVRGAHEVLGVGVIAPDKDGNQVLHIHASLGRGESALTGCLRPGVTTWLVAEAIIHEITDVNAQRQPDERSGFNLLEVD
jgi:predicted DNA-binding protein with PD1-like motif